MNKIKNILLFCTVLPFISYGQPGSNTGIEVARMQFQAKQVISPSPEAAELGKYGNIPVSLFTGTPSVSIPLVELKGNVLSLPISLSYNSSGLKPEEIAPWTGLGWALNAGGVITRSVLGDPDMDDNYFISPSPIGAIPTDEKDKQIYFLSVRDKQKEIQPDIYYYNFMGHTGKFLVYPDGTVQKKEKNFLSIIRWPGAGGEKVYIITDETGMQYEFSEMERTVITPLDDEPGAPPMTVRNFVSSWYLSKLIAPYGNEELDFEYYEPPGAQATVSGSLSNNSVTYSLTDDGSVDWQLLPPASSTNTFHPPSVGITKKIIKKATLKKNSATIGFVDFESDLNQRQDLGDADFNGERLLKNIKLYSTQNGVNNLIKQFALGYEYFGAAQPEMPGNYRRLKLKTVQQISPDISAVPSMPPYTFYYYGESEQMPQRFTSALDHWGFYNGHENLYGSSPNLIPTVDVIYPYLGGSKGLGANRDPDAESATLTMLQKITYPMGGYTSFEYEGNEGNQWNTTTRNYVGGVRIKKMVDYSFPDKPAVIKQYEYKEENGSSSGYSSLFPMYYKTSQYEDASYCPIGYYDQDGNFHTTGHFNKKYSVTISAGSIYGLGSIQGSNIGYDRVTEYQTDLVTNQQLGKTVYTYNIEGFNEFDDKLGNGDLKKKQVYDNSGKLLEETSNIYTYEHDYPGINIRTMTPIEQQSSRTTLYKNSNGQYFYFDPAACINPPSGSTPQLPSVSTQYMVMENFIPQESKKLTSQTNKIFDEATSNYLTTTRTFTYGNTQYNYPTLTEETNSVNEKVFTSVKYVGDYNISCSPQAGSTADNITEMKGHNMMAVPVETLQYRENADGSNRRYISGKFIVPKWGLPEKIYFLQSKPMPLTVTSSQAACDATQLIDPHYQLAASLTYYDDMNVKEETKINDAATTYFWGYNKTYPVAKVFGKTYNEALSSGISQAVLDNPSNVNTLLTELNKLRSLNGALVATYTYKPMTGIASATDPRNRSIYYEYDVLNRLVNIKDNDGNMIQNYKYNYGLGAAPVTSPQTLFYNTALQQDFTKAGCTGGAHGDVVTYSIPYGKYASAVSQADANAKAQLDITANGQAYANSTGLCRWYNASRHVKIFKNDCLPEQGLGGPVWYDVPTGKYKSTISQADADAMAQNDVATLGQVYANEHATCSCGAEGHRIVNGNCETGILYHSGSELQPNGQWKCTYYYSFSDGYITGNYFYYSSSPCPVDP